MSVGRLNTTLFSLHVSLASHLKDLYGHIIKG